MLLYAFSHKVKYITLKSHLKILRKIIFIFFLSIKKHKFQCFTLIEENKENIHPAGSSTDVYIL